MKYFELVKITNLIKAAYWELWDFIRRFEIEKEWVEIWKTVIGDYDYKVAEAAVIIYISTDTKGIAPSPVQIKKIIERISEEGVII